MGEKTKEEVRLPGRQTAEETNEALKEAGIDMSVDEEREKQRDADLKAAHSTPAPDQGPTTNTAETYTRKTGDASKDATKEK